MKLLALVRRQPTTIFSLFVVATLLVLAILGSHAAPYDPLAVDLRQKLQPPSAAHPFGTDDMGRDVLSRVIVGTRLSVQTIVVIMTISVALGLLVGTIAGYFGSYMDEGLMRVTDIFLAFPALILAAGHRRCAGAEPAQCDAGHLPRVVAVVRAYGARPGVIGQREPVRGSGALDRRPS